MCATGRISIHQLGNDGIILYYMVSIKDWDRICLILGSEKIILTDPRI